ncbi:MAG: sigma-70 family RNA polymerase sigma factor [Candidatus Marinimicrobia bacterium]|nr:sigma-70 family RNA polymerase sigma factor [Candidatus Neomarinimicrobiota bacterium]
MPEEQVNIHEYTDEELIARFQAGNENAYLEIVKRFKDRLFSFIYRFVGDADHAEDLVQDTLVKVYTHRHSYREIAKFSTWIYTIAGNLARTELRKRRRRATFNMSALGFGEREIELPSTDDTPAVLHEGARTEEMIRAALAKLPLHFRTVIILRDVQELSYDEISKIMKIPLGTVKSRVNRARLRLQEILTNLEVDRRKAI